MNHSKEKEGVLRNADALRVLASIGVSKTDFDWLRQPRLIQAFRSQPLSRFCEALHAELANHESGKIIDKAEWFRAVQEVFLDPTIREQRHCVFADETFHNNLIIALQKLRLSGKVEALSIPAKFARSLPGRKKDVERLSGKYIRVL